MAKLPTLLFTMLLLVAPAFAATQKTVSPPPKADPALLEFLGSWQTQDGKWVDPMTFARIDPGKLAAEHAHHTDKPLPPLKDGHPGNPLSGGEQGRDI